MGGAIRLLGLVSRAVIGGSIGVTLGAVCGVPISWETITDSGPFGGMTAGSLGGAVMGSFGGAIAGVRFREICHGLGSAGAVGNTSLGRVEVVVIIGAAIGVFVGAAITLYLLFT